MRSAGRQLRHHDVKGQPHLVVERDAVGGVHVSCRKRFEIVQCRGASPLPVSRAESIEADTAHDDGEPPAHVVDLVEVLVDEARKCFLHGVLRLADAAEHAKGDVEQVAVVVTPGRDPVERRTAARGNRPCRSSTFSCSPRLRAVPPPARTRTRRTTVPKCDAASGEPPRVTFLRGGSSFRSDDARQLSPGGSSPAATARPLLSSPAARRARCLGGGVGRLRRVELRRRREVRRHVRHPRV